MPDTYTNFKIYKGNTETGPWDLLATITDKSPLLTPHIVPAKGTTVDVDAATSWMAVGDIVNEIGNGGGQYEVVQILSSTSVKLRYLDIKYNTQSDNLIKLGAYLMPGIFDEGLTEPPVGSTYYYKVEGNTANGELVVFNVGHVTNNAVPSGTPLWADSVGYVAQDTCTCAVTDSAGNTYVGGGVDPFGTPTQQGINHPALVKFSPSGVKLWQKVWYASRNRSFVAAVALASDGNILITGTFGGNPDFGGGPLANHGNYNDIFVVKISSVDGSHIWSTAFGTSNVEFPGDESGYGICCDPSGNVFVCGSYAPAGGMTVYGVGQATSANVPSFSAGQSVFLAKFDSNGAVLWAKGLGSIGNNMGRGVSSDNAGNVFITGQFGTINFGDGDITSNGGKDIFAAKYNSAGALQWKATFGGFSQDIGRAIVVDPIVDDNQGVYVCGDFQFTVLFGTISKTAASYEDCFLLKLKASDGSVQWVSTWGGGNSDYCNAIARDITTGDIVVTGQFWYTISIEGVSLTSTTVFNPFVAKFRADGTLKWAKEYGSLNPEADGYGKRGAGLGLDSSGNVYLVGAYDTLITFSINPLIRSSSHGAIDWFIVKLTA